jgi:PhnB protein
MTSPTEVQPYLFFEGRCEEALEFYRRALGAEVLAMMRVKDSPDPSMAMPGAENNILHASFRVGSSTIMASDGQAQSPAQFRGFALSLNLRDQKEAARLFSALVDGGQAQMPLTKTFFSPSFGMVTDRFGVMWMLYVAP